MAKDNEKEGMTISMDQFSKNPILHILMLLVLGSTVSIASCKTQS